MSNIKQTPDVTVNSTRRCDGQIAARFREYITVIEWDVNGRSQPQGKSDGCILNAPNWSEA